VLKNEVGERERRRWGASPQAQERLSSTRSQKRVA
jgi:hypothetical protein